MKTKKISQEGSSTEISVMIPTDRNGDGLLSLPGDQDDRVNAKASVIRSFKGSLVGVMAAGSLAILSTSAAFAHGGGGGGHGGHFGGFGSHGSAPHQGAHFAQHDSPRGHFRHGRFYPSGEAYWYDYPYDTDYTDENDNYSDPQASPSQVAPAEETIVEVQEALTRLGYYHGEIDGLAGPDTQRAIGWFQSVEKLAVTGRVDDPTLQALKISE
jgi:putative peptidoglycan binding protein